MRHLDPESVSWRSTFSEDEDGIGVIRVRTRNRSVSDLPMISKWRPLEDVRSPLPSYFRGFFRETGSNCHRSSLGDVTRGGVENVL